MNTRRRNIDKGSIEWENGRHKVHLRSMRQLLDKCDNDPEKTDRLKECECVICFYDKSRIGGAVCTFAQCGLCDTRLSSGNTCIDVLCQHCAASTGLCKHCGADLNYVNRRNRNLPSTTKKLEDI